MIEYFIRVGQKESDRFCEICKKHNIYPRHISYDAWVCKAPTSLWAATMTSRDATVLKLSMQLDIMEI